MSRRQKCDIIATKNFNRRDGEEVRVLAPDEIVVKLKEGAFLFEVSQDGGIRMIDKDSKIPFEADIFDIKDMPERIRLERIEPHFVNPGHPSEYLSISLTFSLKAKVSLEVKRVKCRLCCIPLPVQVVEWAEGEKFTSNGLMISPEKPIFTPLGTLHISIPFNIFLFPEFRHPPISGGVQNRWSVDGYLNVFNRDLGETTVLFSDTFTLPETEWLSRFCSPAETHAEV